MVSFILQASNSGSVVNKSAYEKKKTLAEGLLDVGLLIANASQLKAVISAGTAFKYFWPVVVLLGLSIILQVIVGVVLLIMGLGEGDVTKDKQSNKLNNVTVGLIFATTVCNIFSGAFGIEMSGT